MLVSESGEISFSNKCHKIKPSLLFLIQHSILILTGYVFGGEVLRFFHGGDECLTVPTTWSEQQDQKYVCQTLLRESVSLFLSRFGESWFGSEE